MAEPLVVPVLDADPRDVGAWAGEVVAGHAVLLRSAPAPGPAVQEAVALGVAALVDPDDAAAVDAATAALRDSPEQDRRVAAELARRRLAGARPDTAPRVLVVATTAREVQTVRPACRLVTAFGGTCHVVLVRHALRGDTDPAPGAAGVTVVDDPTVTSLLARGERATLLRAPSLAARVLGRAARLVRGRLPRRAAPAADALERSAAALTRVATVLDDVGHRRVWSGTAGRLRPWLLARRSLRHLPQWGPGDLDLVVAPGADAQALVWELLRRDPELESRGSLNTAALTEVVRRRARRLVTG